MRWFPRPSISHLGYVNAVFELVEDGPCDAVLFADERRHSPMHNLREQIGAPQVPLIDLNGRAGAFADACFDINDPASWTATAECISAFRKRRNAMLARFRNTIESDHALLGHAYVSNRPVRAMRYPLAQETVCYPGFATMEDTIPLAEALVRRGLMRKSFFDRLHECSQCSSRRLSVREECPTCRSAQLEQADLVHHYHCATLLPETRFRQGSALVCPKCQQQLRNYGKDYDKPGHQMQCGDCGGLTSEPNVGFVCLDCNARMDGEAIKSFDVFSYELTDQAIELLTDAGRAPQFDAPVWRALPRSLIEEVERTTALRCDVAIAEVSYAGRDAILSANGEAMFDRLRRLFVENMTNMLAEQGSVHAGELADYVILARQDDKLAEQLEQAIGRGEALLKDKLEPKLRLATRPMRAAS